MTKRYFLLACSLLQCLTMIGMDTQSSTELSKSRDDLRCSQDALLRSPSQELNKLAKTVAASNTYYGFYGKFEPVYEYEYKPMPPHHFHSDCP